MNQRKRGGQTQGRDENHTNELDGEERDKATSQKNWLKSSTDKQFHHFMRCCLLFLSISKIFFVMKFDSIENNFIVITTLSAHVLKEFLPILLVNSCPRLKSIYKPAILDLIYVQIFILDMWTIIFLNVKIRYFYGMRIADKLILFLLSFERIMNFTARNQWLSLFVIPMFTVIFTLLFGFGMFSFAVYCHYFLIEFANKDDTEASGLTIACIFSLPLTYFLFLKVSWDLLRFSEN
jgi:hypothetical protein